MKNTRRQTPPVHFPTVPLPVALNNRNGKHRTVVSNVFSDLARLDENSALKIDLVRLGQKKADLRSALHREAKRRAVTLLTTSDERHLYVFRRTLATQKGR